MEDAKKKSSSQAAGKPGKAPNEVMAGLRKQPGIMNLGGKNATKRERTKNTGRDTIEDTFGRDYW